MSDRSFLDREVKIIAMAKWIEGLRDPFVMKMKIAERWGHAGAMSLLASEAIKREQIRAQLFPKEADRARA
jgi:hypothetical protein